MSSVPEGSELDSRSSGDKFELVAASLRSAGGDLDAFVEVLATKLELALPGRVKVERQSVRFLGKQKRVRRLECDLGGRRYLLAADTGAVEARRAEAVRGIVLKSERLPIDAWIDSLAQDLTEQAQANEQSRAALETLLGI